MLPDPVTDPLMSVERAAEALGLSRSTAYRAVRMGDIPTLTIGGRLYVPTAKLRQLVALDDDQAEVIG